MRSMVRMKKDISDNSDVSDDINNDDDDKWNDDVILGMWWLRIVKMMRMKMMQGVADGEVLMMRMMRVLSRKAIMMRTVMLRWC